ncbi:E3 ubiquitin-protein ligase SIAH2 [Callorhinchus milii]|uniref:E3 ubiquitin-protein ligase SIAH2 n=1 Tax=Callorhinchus milii TaxID=7868 RepID=UPI00045715F2|nr:E3 ubiquitin-protein ligase SIAH2 [Callorhinchus milii]|eukprot:gi/632949044/ref/XP_007889930.1/ PREDICTED: seven in absentia homolog 3 [Callorhinchus milii]
MLFFTHCFGFVLDLMHFRYQYHKARTAFSAAVQLVCVVRPTRSLKYLPTSCPLALHHREKARPEPECEISLFSCPCPGASCMWEGSLGAILPHLSHTHNNVSTLWGEHIVFLATDIHLPGAVQWVMIQACFNHHFMLVLEKQEKYEGHQQFFVYVLLIGTPEQAESFLYQLELKRNRRRLTWEATPKGITESPVPVITTNDSLIFDTLMAQLFADKGSLAINVTISTC